MGCVLFGTRKGNTWFQNEAHAMTQGTTEKMGHTGDFFTHVFSGFKQVGALGTSIYSEKKGKQLMFPWGKQ